MLPTFPKNCWTELHEIFREDLSSSKDQSIRFWEQSGQRSRSRSQKGQKRIFVITHSVFARFIWNQHQNVHFSIPYPLIWWQMWRWRRYVLYWVVCMYVCMLPTFFKNYWTELHEIFRDDLSSSNDQLIRFWERSGQRSSSRSKTIGPNYMKFSGMIYHHPRTNWLDFGSDQVKGQGHKKVKNILWTEHCMKFSWDDLSYETKDQVFDFSDSLWELIRSKVKVKVTKRSKYILVVTSSVFVRFIWNQCQKVHFSIPYPLIWWQMWRLWRYALYWVPILVTNKFGNIMVTITFFQLQL